MDAKTLAKSKRAHSQHHKKKSHPGQKAKAPIVVPNNAGNTEKLMGKQVVGEKNHQTRRAPALPSNWDRYDDEFDLDIEDGTSFPSDVVVPKSKGADYRHLIAEAESQSQSQSCSYSDSFTLFDDVMQGDFIQGVCSMLSVRGEGILSWAGDDNFVVEDKLSSAQEASFLSLNLNALAEQLEKVDLPQRLFMEADILPPELVREGSSASSNQESCLMQSTQESKEIASNNSSSQKGADRIRATYESEVAANTSKDKVSDVFSNEVEITSTASFSSEGVDLSDWVKNDRNFGQRKELEPESQSAEYPVENSHKKPSKFEAAAAEAELDMLLGSFSETQIPDSSGTKFSNNFAGSQQASTMTLPELSGKGPGLSKPASINASFDDMLDDLFEETSDLAKCSSLSQPPAVNVVRQGSDHSASSTVTKPKVLDDFDSWLDTL